MSAPAEREGPGTGGAGTGAGAGGARGRRTPEATVVRLPLYQRILTELRREGSRTVSSEELALRARVNAAKVRKDFSLFGSFGTRGTGYDVDFLLAQVERTLGTDRDWPVAIVGIGNLGRALAGSAGFSSNGFRVAGLFDVRPGVVGEHVGGLTVRHVDELATLAGDEAPAIGVVATPASAAQSVADALVHAGVGAILNFAPRVLSVPSIVLVRSVDLSIELQVMGFLLARRDVGPRGAVGAAVPATGAQGGAVVPAAGAQGGADLRAGHGPS